MSGRSLLTLMLLDRLGTGAHLFPELWAETLSSLSIVRTTVGISNRAAIIASLLEVTNAARRSRGHRDGRWARHRPRLFAGHRSRGRQGRRRGHRWSGGG